MKNPLYFLLLLGIIVILAFLCIALEFNSNRVQFVEREHSENINTNDSSELACREKFEQCYREYLTEVKQIADQDISTNSTYHRVIINRNRYRQTTYWTKNVKFHNNGNIEFNNVVFSSPYEVHNISKYQYYLKLHSKVFKYECNKDHQPQFKQLVHTFQLMELNKKFFEQGSI